MILHVRSDASITLEDPDTFTAFSVKAGSLDLPEILSAFGEDAKADEAEGESGHLWVSIPRLHRLGAEYGGVDWRKGCDGMIRFAASKGWVDENRQLVRAHIER